MRTLHPSGAAAGLEWSSTGRLLVWGAHAIDVFGPRSAHLEPLGPGSAPVTTAKFSPEGRSIAFVQAAAGRSVVWLFPRLRPDATFARRIFTGAGTFGSLVWSPDGRWLALGWDSADQLLFLRAPSVRKILSRSRRKEAFLMTTVLASSRRATRLDG